MSFVSLLAEIRRPEQTQTVEERHFNDEDDISSESAVSFAPNPDSDYEFLTIPNILSTQLLHLQKNRQILARNMDRNQPNNKRWHSYENKMLPDGPPEIVIRKPTASKIFHGNVHPGLYRNLQSFDDLQAFAAQLGVRDWEASADRILRKRSIRKFYSQLREVGVNKLESKVEYEFGWLVGQIAQALRKPWRKWQDENIVVKGLLVNHELAVRGQPDYAFYNPDVGGFYLATECKRIETWNTGATWYRQSLCIQSMMAMFAFDCPLILYTQSQLKILALNSNTHRIRTFPCVVEPNYLPGYTAFEMANDEDCLIRAIVICLLATPTRNETFLPGPIVTSSDNVIFDTDTQSDDAKPKTKKVEPPDSARKKIPTKRGSTAKKRKQSSGSDYYDSKYNASKALDALSALKPERALKKVIKYAEFTESEKPDSDPSEDPAHGIEAAQGRRKCFFTHNDIITGEPVYQDVVVFGLELTGEMENYLKGYERMKRLYYAKLDDEPDFAVEIEGRSNLDSGEEADLEDDGEMEVEVGVSDVIHEDVSGDILKHNIQKTESQETLTAEFSDL